MLGYHPQAEVLQHRQHVRDRHRVCEPRDLQVHALGPPSGGTVQTQLQSARLLAQRLEVAQIVEHLLRGYVLLVGERKGVPVARHERQSRRLPALADEHLAQPVGPGERRLGDATLDCGEIGLVTPARIGAHYHVHARVARAGDLRLALDAGAGEALERNLLDALAHFGVVTIARHVHQA